MGNTAVAKLNIAAASLMRSGFTNTCTPCRMPEAMMREQIKFKLRHYPKFESLPDLPDCALPVD